MPDNEFDVTVVSWGPVGHMASIPLEEKGYHVASLEGWPAHPLVCVRSLRLARGQLNSQDVVHERMQ